MLLLLNLLLAAQDDSSPHSHQLRLRFADAERGSRVSKAHLDLRYERVRAAKDAPRNPCRVLERRHGFADITERGAGVRVLPLLI